MAIDKRTLALIHADIDGELDDAQRQALTEALAADPDAAALHRRLQELGKQLAAEPELEPPASLRASILQATASARPEPPGVLMTLLTAPALRYAATFVAGAIMTAVILDTNNTTSNAFRDVTGLVGTVGDATASRPSVASVTINRAEITGTVSLQSARPITILDIDMNTSGPVDVVARYRDRSVWFNGFAQLESPGTDLSVGTGEIRIRIDGKRRYALYLRNSGDRPLELELEFFRNGVPIYKTTLSHGKSG